MPNLNTMAESLPAHIDESKIPPYPDNLEGMKLESTTEAPPFKSNGSHSTSFAHLKDQHSTSKTLNARKGAFEFGHMMEDVVGSYVIVPLKNYSASSGYTNHTNFNFWNGRGDIAFHISFRRQDRTIRFNSASGGHWGKESYINFPSNLKAEKNIDLKVNYISPGRYWVDIGDSQWDIHVDPRTAPDSLTYRSDSNAMFGQNVDATNYYMA
ncbi:hypothetical protein B7463_g7373, partial [Scytalidium lignicola]